MAFVICMFDVVRMSPTMQKVIRSLTYNIDQVTLNLQVANHLVIVLDFSFRS